MLDIVMKCLSYKICLMVDCRYNIPAFENVANLELLPATGAYIVALSMKIKNGSGGPLRVVGWVER
jgi:kynurenine formamidase